MCIYAIDGRYDRKWGGETTFIDIADDAETSEEIEAILQRRFEEECAFPKLTPKRAAPE